MAELTVAAAFAAMLIALSLRANAEFRRADRLPMQWSITGAVNWTAPRALALAFTPLLGIGTLAFMVVMMNRSTPRPGQEGLELPVLTMMGLGLIAMHLLHLRLIRRTLARGRG